MMASIVRVTIGSVYENDEEYTVIVKVNMTSRDSKSCIV